MVQVEREVTARTGFAGRGSGDPVEGGFGADMNLRPCISMREWYPAPTSARVFAKWATSSWTTQADQSVSPAPRFIFDAGLFCSWWR